MKDKVVLSIEVMTSGTRQELKKCIAALDHLRNSVSCQLVIVDTGCQNPNMKSYLAEVADTIVVFPWVNDFSSARNAGLSAAVGEWFMYMDDDEWFESTDNIESFFLNGDYRDYLRADYIVRNYRLPDGSEYEDCRVSRMHIICEGLSFHGKIHEVFSAPEDNRAVPLLCDYVHHYGYIRSRKQLGDNKSLRNIPLLEEMLREEPLETRWYIHLEKEYVNQGDFIKAKQIACLAMEHIDYHNMFRNDLYEFLIVILHGLLQEEKYAQGIEQCSEFLEMGRQAAAFDEKSYRLFRGQIYIILGTFLTGSGEIDNLLQTCCNYYKCAYEFIRELDSEEYSRLAGSIACKEDISSVEECLFIYRIMAGDDIQERLSAVTTAYGAPGTKRAFGIPAMNNVLHNIIRSCIYYGDHQGIRACFLVMDSGFYKTDYDDRSFISSIADWIACNDDRPEVKTVVDIMLARDDIRDWILREVKKAQNRRKVKMITSDGDKPHRALTDDIKNKISELIGYGSYKDAEYILKKYLEIIPDDIDARHLLQQVRWHMPSREKRILIVITHMTYWKAMSSIYMAARKDPAAGVLVVPVPYIVRGNDENTEFRYEGLSFPENVPILDYRRFIPARAYPEFLFIADKDYSGCEYILYKDYAVKILSECCDYIIPVPVESITGTEDGQRFYRNVVYGENSLK